MNGSIVPLSFQAWPRRARDRLRWLARRWRFALAGFALGVVLVAWLHADAINMLRDHQDQVESLRQQLATLQGQTLTTQQRSGALQGPPKGLAWLPAKDNQALIWLQLSRLLGQHAVQLRTLRPVPERVVAPVASQAVAVRLYADFDDWAAFWADLNARGPVWSIDRLRITPQGVGVDIEAVLRVWLSDGLTRPDSGSTMAVWPGAALLGGAALQPVSAAGQPPMASEVFVRQQSTLDAPRAALVDGGERGATGMAAAAALGMATWHPDAGNTRPLVAPPSLSADPGQWPLDQVRLLGVWHQAQGAQAILAAGPHWVSARVGQALGPQGHRIESIHDHQVHLRANSGEVRVLDFEKARP